MVQIEDICELKYGKALKKENRRGGAVPVYGSNGIVGHHDKPLVKKKTIIIGRKGSVGEVHFAHLPSWPIDTTYYVRFKDPGISIEWFYRILKTLRLNELNRSAAIPGLNRDDVYRIKIHKPKLKDQIRIATLLSRVEALIAARKENLRLLDEFLKSAFLEIFGDPVRNDRGWETSTIKGLCKDIIDCPHSTPIYSDEKTGYFCVRSSDIVDGYLDLSRTYNVSKQVYDDRIKRYEPKTGDIIYSREGGRLGNAARILGDEKICLGQRMMLFSVSSNNQSDFLWALLESPSFKFKLQSLVGGGAAPRVNIKDIKKIVVIKPIKKKQEEFSNIVKKIDGIKSLYLQNLNELGNLYGALSQKAFKGELDLSKIPLEKVFETQIDEHVQESEAGTPFFPPLDHEVMTDPIARKKLLRQIFEDYFKSEPKRSLSFNDFWSRVEFKVLDYMDEESPPLGVEDYNQIKAWLFNHLKRGDVEQYFNDDENQIKLRFKS